HMEFERGKKASDLKVIGKGTKSGTKVTFKPDEKIFPEIEFKWEVVQKRARELAYLNEGIQIIVEDERSGKKEDFKYDQGLVEYVKYLNDGKNILHPIVYFKKEILHEQEDGKAPLTYVVEVAMQYNDGYADTIESFANNINTHEGGTHLS